MPADSGFYVQPLGMSYKGNNMITCLVVNPDRKIFNPYAAGGLFGQYKMMQKKIKKKLEPWQTGTHPRVLSDSFPMNTNMIGFGCTLDESSLSTGRVNDGKTKTVTRQYKM